MIKNVKSHEYTESRLTPLTWKRESERERYERNPLDNEQIKVRLQTKSIKMNKTYNIN